MSDADPAAGILATISYGWEPLSFYRNWASFLNDEDLKLFRGPALDMTHPQSEYASYFLKTFKEQLRDDKEYAERFRRHYAYVKRKTGMHLPLDASKWGDFKGTCPCASGKAFEHCCGAFSMLEKRRMRTRRKRR